MAALFIVLLILCGLFLYVAKTMDSAENYNALAFAFVGCLFGVVAVIVGLTKLLMVVI